MAGIEAGAAFEDQGGPDELFQAAVRRAINAIESKDRDDLLPRFLSLGPRCGPGPLTPEVADRHMSDGEVATAIRFVFSSAINSFQGQLAEMLAIGPVVRLWNEIARQAGASGRARTFVGDTVLAHPIRRRTWAKAADLHLLDCGGNRESPRRVTVHGLVEVKSYSASAEVLRRQLQRHVERARAGLLILGVEFPRVALDPGGLARVVVTPATWALPRRFFFEKVGEREFLVVAPATPPNIEDRVESLGANRWQVKLRWSKEALADAAFAMTFWYMGEVGRLLYEDAGVPREWSEMTPEQAGQNAVKMMLYYAILRARTRPEESRAIALYNSYGFGYSLGANFVDRGGRREVLFFDDLHEILASGRSRTSSRDKSQPRQRCRIRGYQHEAVPPPREERPNPGIKSPARRASTKSHQAVRGSKHRKER